MSELNLAPIPRVENINRTEFQKSFFKPHYPLIIKEMATHWPALRKWTPDFFKTNYGHKQVRIYDASFATHGENYMSNVRTLLLKDYIDLIMTTSQDLRMFLYNIKSQIPEIIEDVQFPPIASGFSKNFIFMFFGCKGSATQMHFDIDMSHVFHTAIYGKKTITLYPYEESGDLYRHPFTCRSYVDVHNPDFEKFPRLKNARGYRDVLEPGETLFMPAGYWHHTVYNESGYAVTHRCSQQSWLSNLHGYYNLFVMSPIDRIMNKISPEGWFRWKEQQTKVFI